MSEEKDYIISKLSETEEILENNNTEDSEIEEYSVSSISSNNSDNNNNVESTCINQYNDNNKNYKGEEVNEKEVNNDIFLSTCINNDKLENFIYMQTNRPRLFLYSPWEPLKNEHELHDFLSNTKHLDTFDRKYKMSKNFILKCLNNYKLLGISSDDANIIKKHYFNSTNYLHDGSLENNIESTYETTNSAIQGNQIQTIQDNITNSIDQNIQTNQDNNINHDNKTCPDNKTCTDNKTCPDNKTGPDNKISLENKIGPDIKTGYDNKTNYLTQETQSVKKPDIIEISDDKNLEINKTNADAVITFRSTYNTSYIEKNDKRNKLKNKREKIIDQKNKIEELLFNKTATSIIDKKIKIIRFFKDYDIILENDFFDIKDVNNELIINEKTISDWYNKIITIESRKSNAFDPSIFLLIGVLWMVEWMANKLNIIELKDLTKNINVDELPLELYSVKECIDECIFEKLPKNPFLDLFFYIGGVYIKNKTGVNLMKIIKG